MTPQEQKRRSIIQARCIRKYAEVEHVNNDQAFVLWCSRGLAEQWANYYD